MEPELITLITGFLDLGFPAIVLVGLWYLWQAYRNRTDQTIQILKNHALNCQREKELYAGILLDRAKAGIYRFPDTTEMRALPDTGQLRPPSDSTQ